MDNFLTLFDAKENVVESKCGVIFSIVLSVHAFSTPSFWRTSLIGIADIKYRRDERCATL